MEFSTSTSLVVPTRTLEAPPLRLGKLRTGAMVDITTWAQAFVNDRQVLRARAVYHLARGPIVYSHITAAAIWDLPLVGVPHCAPVHTTPLGLHPPKTHGDVVRHKLALPSADVTERNGLPVTTLDRTIFDVIRTQRLDAAVAVFDAALRLVAWDEARHAVNVAAAERFRADVRARVFAAPGARGIRTARLALELADPRAQLPGEALSRVRMWELSMPAPVLQLAVDTAKGRRYLDFAWPTLRRFGEFDGLIKLYEPEYTRGRDVAAIQAEQRERRAAIEVATGWQGMSWGWESLVDAGTFWTTLRAQGWPESGRLDA
jgi:hypothetical protein